MARSLLLATLLCLAAFPAAAATLVVTFAFASDAQSFVATPGASVTASWVAGTLQSDLSIKNNAARITQWNRTLTYVDMGVPGGSMITGISSASAQSQCTVYTSPGATHQANASTLVDGATTVTLSAARTFSAVEGAMVTSTGTNVSGMSSPASNSVTLKLANTLSTANTAGAHMAIKQDNLTFTITYTPAAFVPGGMVTAPFPGRL